jgi:hypothetical protein
MSSPATPATSLHDVVVTNEQTRVEWHAGLASIERGLIVIAANTPPPDDLLARHGATFTLVAYDGGDRIRRFTGVTYAAAESAPPTKFVFQ